MTPASAVLPAGFCDLPIRRIAITVPPDTWFHGIAKAMQALYRQGLVNLGLSVFDVPVEPFLARDAGRIAEILEALRAFGPDMAMGLPKGSYALLCRLPAGRNGWRPNVFTDVLDIPTVCFWDHAPLELADQLLAPLPEGPSASSPGALPVLRRTLSHPRIVHWSRDRGQTRIMQALALLGPHPVIHEMPPALPGFTAPDDSASAHSAVVQPAGRPDVAFVGHVYQDDARDAAPALAALAHDAMESWAAGDPNGSSLWQLLVDRIDALEPGERENLALDPDHRFFWRFAHGVVLHRGQTLARLRTLEALRRPIACYGNVRPDASATPRNLVPVAGHIPFGPALSRVLALHPVVVDVLNPGSIDGYSHKPVLAFASGGFMLVNRRTHWLEAFGEAGDAAAYGSRDELAAKVERFLQAPRARREVGDAIRERLAQHFQLEQVLARVVRAAFQPIDARHAGRGSHDPGPVPAGVLRANLLEHLRTEAHWNAALTRQAGRAEVRTPAQVWAYAAALDVPGVSGLHEPFLQFDVAVDAGRIGIAVADDATGALVDEQMLGVTDAAVPIVIELTGAGSSVIIRNAADGESRARILGARLYERQQGVPPVYR